MPLTKSKSKAAFGKNVETEMDAGKSQKQSLAIAYAMKRKAKKKMAEGGKVGGAKTSTTGNKTKTGGMDPSDEDDAMMMADGGPVDEDDIHAPPTDAHKTAPKKTQPTEPTATPTPKPMMKRLEDAFTNPNGTDDLLDIFKQNLAKGGAIDNKKQRAMEAFHGKKMADGGDADTQEAEDAAYRVAPRKSTTETAGPSAQTWKDAGEVHELLQKQKDLLDNPHDEDSFKEGQHMAKGGEMQTKQGYQSNKVGTLTKPDLKDHEKDSGFASHEGNDTKACPKCGHEDARALNQHGAIEEGPQGTWMAEGGQITDNYSDTEDSDGQDMVGRIMKQRQQAFSKGGRVANQDSIEAGFAPNEFDDLHLRDDLKSTYGDDDNSGDSLGNAREDADRKDTVARIMKSRAKKDRLPNPR